MASTEIEDSEDRQFRTASLVYLELDKPAKALTEYADRPQDVRAWVDGLLELEGS
jgi:hypothetical protein